MEGSAISSEEADQYSKVGVHAHSSDMRCELKRGSAASLPQEVEATLALIREDPEALRQFLVNHFHMRGKYDALMKAMVRSNGALCRVRASSVGLT